MRIFLVLVAVALMGCGHSGPVAGVSTQERIEQSKAIGQSFMKSLKGELETAIATQGLDGAIEVCKTVSQEEARKAEAAHPEIVSLRRVSLKTRNPEAHTPDPDERALLLAMEQSLKNDGRVAPRVRQTAEVDTVLMPIVIQESTCLLCHGPREWQPDALQKALETHYPDDRAVGYALGDFRGALSIRWRN